MIAFMTPWAGAGWGLRPWGPRSPGSRGSGGPQGELLLWWWTPSAGSFSGSPARLCARPWQVPLP